MDIEKQKTNMTAMPFDYAEDENIVEEESSFLDSEKRKSSIKAETPMVKIGELDISEK